MQCTCSWCIIILICFRNQSAGVWLRVFVSLFIKDIGLKFSLLVVSLSGFDIRVTRASQSELRSVPSSVLWTSSRIGVNSLDVVELNHETI